MTNATVTAVWTDSEGRRWDVRGHLNPGSPGGEPTYGSSWVPGEPPHVEDMEMEIHKRGWQPVESYTTHAEAIEIEELLLGI